jgi:LysM repeat protein
MPFPMLPIVIIERTGARRPVILVNAMLPRSGGYTNFGIKQRTKVTRYMGNAHATAQVLGPEYMPIQFAGTLEDRRLGAPGASLAIMLLIQSIVKSGRECWFNYGPVFRRVLWKQADFKTIELQKIKYEIELEVLDDGLGQRKKVKEGTRIKPSTEQAIGDINGAKADVGDVPEWVDPDAVAGANDSLDSALSHTEEAGKQLDLIGTEGELLDQSAAKNALTQCESARDDLNDAANFTNRFEWENGINQGYSETQSLSEAGAGVLKADSSVLKAGGSVLELRDKTSILAGNSEIGRVYVAAQGDTLQSISAKTYGSAYDWGKIYQANGMTNPILQGGEQLILPNYSPTDLGAPRLSTGGATR